MGNVAAYMLGPMDKMCKPVMVAPPSSVMADRTELVSSSGACVSSSTLLVVRSNPRNGAAGRTVAHKRLVKQSSYLICLESLSC